MFKELVIYGAGGHGKVIAEILSVSGRSLLGFIDDSLPLVGATVLDLPVFASGEWMRFHPGGGIALGIGDNHARERAAVRVKGHGCRLLTAIHPAAIIARKVRIADGVAIMPAAVLNPDCQLGEGTIVNSAAVVEHDVVIDPYAHLSPNCTVGGGANIGAFAHIGIGATVLPGKRIGADCVIGAGAVVVDDIPNGQVAYGVPARIRHVGELK